MDRWLKNEDGDVALEALLTASLIGWGILLV